MKNLPFSNNQAIRPCSIFPSIFLIEKCSLFICVHPKFRLVDQLVHPTRRYINSVIVDWLSNLIRLVIAMATVSCIASSSSSLWMLWLAAFRCENRKYPYAEFTTGNVSPGRSDRLRLRYIWIILPFVYYLQEPANLYACAHNFS